MKFFMDIHPSPFTPQPSAPSLRPSALDRAVSGAAGAPLSAQQRQRLCALASRAWKQRCAQGLAAAPVAGVVDPGLFERFRHEENFKSCHKEHLRACTQADWPALKAHYLRLLGDREQARRLELRQATQGAAMALAKLRAEAERAGDVIARPFDYVGAIARARFKLPLEQLGAKQIWTLVFDLRRNAQRRRKGLAVGRVSDPAQLEVDT